MDLLNHSFSKNGWNFKNFMRQNYPKTLKGLNPMNHGENAWNMSHNTTA